MSSYVDLIEIEQSVVDWALKDFLVTDSTGMPGMVEITTPFNTHDNNPLKVYAYYGDDDRLYISDCRFMVTSFNSVPIVGPSVKVNMKLLQDMIHTFGLILTEKGAVVESSELQIGQRIMNLVAGLIATDGLRRLWTLGQNS